MLVKSIFVHVAAIVGGLLVVLSALTLFVSGFDFAADAGRNFFGYEHRVTGVLVYVALTVGFLIGVGKPVADYFEEKERSKEKERDRVWDLYASNCLKLRDPRRRIAQSKPVGLE